MKTEIQKRIFVSGLIGIASAFCLAPLYAQTKDSSSSAARPASPTLRTSPVATAHIILGEKLTPFPPPVDDFPEVPPAPSLPERDLQNELETTDPAAQRRESRRKVYLSLYRMRFLDDKATKSREFRKKINNENAEQLEIQRKLIEKNRENFEASRKKESISRPSK
jgi:hypothetical protein